MQADKRYPHLDALRGLALWGIFIVNIVWFSFPSARFGELYGGGPNWYNDVINFVRVELFGGRTATVFALLFGLGMSMQWNKWQSSWLLIKRNLVLALFGILHIVLLLGGDILLDYALFGLVGVLLLRFNKKVLLGIAILLALYPSALMVLRHFEIVGAASSYKGMTLTVEEMVQLFQQGNFIDQCLYRIEQYQHIWKNPWVLSFYFPPVVACYIMGLYLGQANFLQSLSNVGRYNLLLGITLFLKVMLSIVNHLPIELFTYFKTTITFKVWMQWDQYITTLLFVSLVVVTIKSKIWKPFQVLGKMSLTTYIGESILSSILFYAFGFAQYNLLTPLQIQLYCLLFTLMLLTFNYFWELKVGQGPLEWVWRKLSYGKHFQKSTQNVTEKVV
ncbi:DUF418 domain-containing protein [Limibacter armeniacum]|uniref:DUF418 domain-containing protein n=1 Tax=Limibacter armeniacum TaxID=466084 RepID=UPI002FE58CD9